MRKDPQGLSAGWTLSFLASHSPGAKVSKMNELLFHQQGEVCTRTQVRREAQIRPKRGFGPFSWSVSSHFAITNNRKKSSEEKTPVLNFPAASTC